VLARDAVVPKARFGLLWAVATVAVVVAGRPWVAVWFAAFAGVAALQVSRALRSRDSRPMIAIAGAASAALPLAAAVSLDAMSALLAAAVVVSLVVRAVRPSSSPVRDVAATVVLAAAIGLAGASPVLLRALGMTPPLFLLALLAAYDVGSYLVGTESSLVWEGPVAGVASMLPVTLIAVVVASPPFNGAGPWLLALLAACLAPAGQFAGALLTGQGPARVPALRRLDSMLLAGPVWALLALLLAHP
jgi:hypothetical protein